MRSVLSSLSSAGACYSKVNYILCPSPAQSPIILPHLHGKSQRYGRRDVSVAKSQNHRTHAHGSEDLDSEELDRSAAGIGFTRRAARRRLVSRKMPVAVEIIQEKQDVQNLVDLVAAVSAASWLKLLRRQEPKPIGG